MLSQETDLPNLGAVIRSLLNRLSVRERKAIQALYWDGMSQREAARELRVSKTAVFEYRNRALRKLGSLFIEKLMIPKGLELKSKPSGQQACDR